mmetsp:Transcript_77/g.236  ORF Transcript_77/g.236 Transcript_77/m.236 type:complete len:352 (+) Transcript_77:364-1419(+)|eukprot:CAMPEP_0117664244 /NCGR_PEP_ID=MMETSP0804-20121206/9104_1 /TAXON_ID=1074897 /ORGANISM="Tetraselmis astigmatica, Strain CCMP880" /LENGTH=351 /DNA_ID=CAMNT_0005471439 /DNA_START=241 /DNA_END=1296 /DNA_ORIENTATION=+
MGRVSTRSLSGATAVLVAIALQCAFLCQAPSMAAGASNTGEPGVISRWTGGSTSELPPGCECTVADCCAMEGGCDMLETFADFTSYLDPEGFCAAWQTNSSATSNSSSLASTVGICEAILQDPSFILRFASGADSWNLWTIAEEGVTCADLAAQPTCFSANHSSSGARRYIDTFGTQNGFSERLCSRVTTPFTNTSSVISSWKCSAEQEGMQVFSGLVPTTDIDVTNVCPTSVNGIFDDSTASGKGGMRWQCYDVVAPRDSSNVAVANNTGDTRLAAREALASSAGDATNMRFLYISLGDAPCFGTYSPILPPTPAPTPSPSDDSSAVRTAEAFISAAALVLVMHVAFFFA